MLVRDRLIGGETLGFPHVFERLGLAEFKMVACCDAGTAVRHQKRRRPQVPGDGPAAYGFPPVPRERLLAAGCRDRRTRSPGIEPVTLVAYPFSLSPSVHLRQRDGSVVEGAAEPGAVGVEQLGGWHLGVC